MVSGQWQTWRYTSFLNDSIMKITFSCIIYTWLFLRYYQTFSKTQIIKDVLNTKIFYCICCLLCFHMMFLTEALWFCILYKSAFLILFPHNKPDTRDITVVLCLCKNVCSPIQHICHEFYIYEDDNVQFVLNFYVRC